MVDHLKIARSADKLPIVDADALGERFRPGEWLDRRQKNLSNFTVISGCYQRDAPVQGRWYSERLHYFDMCLAVRPAETKIKFEERFQAAKSIGEVFFVPARNSFIGESGAGRQRNLFIFLDAHPLSDDEFLLSNTLNDIPLTALHECVDLRSESIKQILQNIARELYDPGFGSEVMLEGLGLTLLTETARLLKEQRKPVDRKGGLSPRAVRLIRERVMEGETWPSISELAQLCGLSRRHLMRAFYEETGQTVGAFVQQAVIEHARQLLQATDTPIGLVANRVGFTNAAAFSTAFRRATGESPRNYRQRHSTLRLFD